MVQSKEQHTAKTKNLAIKYYLKKEISQDKVSEIFNINPRTFRRCLEAYKNNEKLDRLKRRTIVEDIRSKQSKLQKSVY